MHCWIAILLTKRPFCQLAKSCSGHQHCHATLSFPQRHRKPSCPQSTLIARCWHRRRLGCGHATVNSVKWPRNQGWTFQQRPPSQQPQAAARVPGRPSDPSITDWLSRQPNKLCMTTPSRDHMWQPKQSAQMSSAQGQHQVMNAIC